MKELLKNISPFNNRTEMPTIVFVIKKILAFWLCYIAGLFIAEGAVILLHFAFGKNMLVGDVFDTQTITLITYYGYILVTATALLYQKIIEKKPLSKIGLTKHFGSYFIGAVLGILFIAVTVIAVILTGSMEFVGVFDNPNIPLIILLTGGFVVQGATEEILCRGIVFHSLKEKTSVGVAANISTAMFIIPHLSSLFVGGAIYGVFGIINLFLISTVFSLLTIDFKSLWAACGLHSFWNAALYCILGLNLSGNDETVAAVFNLQSANENILNGGKYGIEASVVTTVVLAVAVFLIWYIGRKRRKKS